MQEIRGNQTELVEHGIGHGNEIQEMSNFEIEHVGGGQFGTPPYPGGDNLPGWMVHTNEKWYSINETGLN